MIYKNKSYIYSIQFAFYAKQTLFRDTEKGERTAKKRRVT